MAMSAEDIQDKIDALELALASGSLGSVVSVTIDGISTNYKFEQAVEELRFWENRLAMLSGTRRIFGTIDLRNV